MNRKTDDDAQNQQYSDTNCDFFPSFHSFRHIRVVRFPRQFSKYRLSSDEKLLRAVQVTDTHSLVRSCPLESSRSKLEGVPRPVTVGKSCHCPRNPTL